MRNPQKERIDSKTRNALCFAILNPAAVPARRRTIALLLVPFSLLPFFLYIIHSLWKKLSARAAFFLLYFLLSKYKKSGACPDFL